MDRVKVKQAALLSCNPERSTMTVRFGEVRMTRKIDVRCVKCKKKLRRTVDAFQTINPYNVNKETGRPKTEQDIRAELPAELDKAERHERKTALCRNCTTE